MFFQNQPNLFKIFISIILCIIVSLAALFSIKYSSVHKAAEDDLEPNIVNYDDINQEELYNLIQDPNKLMNLIKLNNDLKEKNKNNSELISHLNDQIEFSENRILEANKLIEIQKEKINTLTKENNDLKKR